MVDTNVYILFISPIKCYTEGESCVAISLYSSFDIQDKRLCVGGKCDGSRKFHTILNDNELSEVISLFNQSWQTNQTKE